MLARVGCRGLRGCGRLGDVPGAGGPKGIDWLLPSWLVDWYNQKFYSSYPAPPAPAISATVAYTNQPYARATAPSTAVPGTDYADMPLQSSLDTQAQYQRQLREFFNAVSDANPVGSNLWLYAALAGGAVGLWAVLSKRRR